MNIKNISIILISLLFSAIASATNYYVNSNGNDNNSGKSEEDAYLTLNRAFLVNTFQDGDMVLIGEGTYTLTRPLTWDAGITIKGSGAENTIIQASESPIRDKASVYSFSVFYNQKPHNCDQSVPESTIQDLTIRHGAAPIGEPKPTSVGGGVKNFAHLTINNCILENNVALNGGAIYNEGTLVLQNSIIRNNHAFNFRGGVFNTGDAEFSETKNVYESNTQDYIDSGIYPINNFENGFSGQSGTDGNYEGGYVKDSPKFTIVNNPDISGINFSEKAGKFTRKRDGHWWAYAWFEFDQINIFDTPKYLHIMVYKPVISQVCVQVKDGRTPTDGNNTGELINNNQTLTGEWQDLVYEINTSGSYSYIEIKPDFENTSTPERLDNDIEIYFDEIVINDSPDPRTLPE